MSRVIKIKDVAILNKETYKKNEFPDYINYLDTGSLTKNKVEGFQYLNTKKDKIPSRAQRKIKKHSILYSTVRPNQEHYGFFESSINDIVASTGFTTIDVVDDNVNAKFLYYLLTQHHITEYLHAIGMNSVSSYPSISPNDIGDLKFKVPSKETQKSIAKVLSDLDAKIELNNKINRELESMAKTLYDYWFVQFDFPNEQGKPYKSSGGKMVYNEKLKREIPEGWAVEKMIKNMDVQYGFPYSTKLFNNDKNGAPVIRIRDILESTISLYSTEKADDKYKIDRGDLLIGMDGNFHMNFWDKDNCYLNQRCVKIKQKNGYSVSTFQTLFDTQPYIKAREKNVSRTTVGHLSANDINGLNVLKATENIQHKANIIFNTTLDKILINRNQNQQLSSLRDWLLPMLMNGQVTVRQAHGSAVGEAEEKLNSSAKLSRSMAAEPHEKYKTKN